MIFTIIYHILVMISWTDFTSDDKSRWSFHKWLIQLAYKEFKGNLKWTDASVVWVWPGRRTAKLVVNITEFWFSYWDFEYKMLNVIIFRPYLNERSDFLMKINFGSGWTAWDYFDTSTLLIHHIPLASIETDIRAGSRRSGFK